jgi:membrane protein YdbS with pleckstrin-like domain
MRALLAGVLVLLLAAIGLGLLLAGAHEANGWLIASGGLLLVAACVTEFYINDERR